MKYSEIKSPEELLEYMECIDYGIYTDGKKYTSDNKDYNEILFNKWRLSSPEELIKNKVGHCYDTVELERDWFSKNNYKFKTYFVMFLLDYENDYSTHTYLIYEENNKYKLFEYSDYLNKGIHEYDSLDDAIRAQSKRQIECNDVNEEEINKLTVFEYDGIKFGVNFFEFIDYILENGKEYM